MIHIFEIIGGIGLLGAILRICRPSRHRQPFRW